ncbi:MAG TPA: hypothetical protein VGG49_09130 [Steroidobacteraceae bacterium]|jgi:hypothetical protein
MAKLRILEVRKLLLPVETVVDAVLELDRSHGGTLASAKLLEARVETGADPGLSLLITKGAGDSAAAIQKRYTLPAIAAAAIHYCFRARIPLPRQATKSIEVVPEGFQLTIQTLTEVPRLHGAAPTVSQVAQEPQGPIVAAGDAALDDPTSSEPETADASETASEVDTPATAAA